jgi:hypothetical protein
MKPAALSTFISRNETTDIDFYELQSTKLQVRFQFDSPSSLYPN